jgi:TRAP-type C4-dicarboxylate transport system substrate-binding protein
MVTHQVTSTVKALTLFDLPFLFHDEKAADKILYGPIARKLLDLLDEYGYHGLSFAEEDFRDITNSKHEIKKMEDLRDLKIRVANQTMHIKTIECLGGNPVPVKYDEVYNVLHERSVDGQDMPLVTAFNNYLMDVQSYLTLTHHSYASSVILCSQGLWESLDSKEKQQFEAVATESARYIAELTRRKTKELQESESEKGLIITTLSDDERKKCVLRYSRYITSLVKRTVLIYS